MTALHYRDQPWLTLSTKTHHSCQLLTRAKTHSIEALDVTAFPQLCPLQDNRVTFLLCAFHDASVSLLTLSTWYNHQDLALPVVTRPAFSSSPLLSQPLTAISAHTASLHKPRMQTQALQLILFPTTLNMQWAPGICANSDQYSSMEWPISFVAELWRQPLSLQDGWMPPRAAFHFIPYDWMHHWQTTHRKGR